MNDAIGSEQYSIVDHWDFIDNFPYWSYISLPCLSENCQRGNMASIYLIGENNLQLSIHAIIQKGLIYIVLSQTKLYLLFNTQGHLNPFSIENEQRNQNIDMIRLHSRHVSVAKK